MSILMGKKFTPAVSNHFCLGGGCGGWGSDIEAQTNCRNQPKKGGPETCCKTLSFKEVPKRMLCKIDPKSWNV